MGSRSFWSIVNCLHCSGPAAGRAAWLGMCGGVELLTCDGQEKGGRKGRENIPSDLTSS